MEITPQGRAAVEHATMELNDKVFTKPCFSAPEVDGLNQVLGTFRHDAGYFVATRFPISTSGRGLIQLNTGVFSARKARVPVSGSPLAAIWCC